ncbi:MAG: hypothetical protein WA971_12200 [Microbacterium sp.]
MNRSHGFRVPASVPAAVVRVLLVAVVVLGVFLLNPVPMWRGVALIAGVIGAAVPRSMAAWAAAACLPLGLMMTAPDPRRTALAVLLVHAVHVLGSITVTVPLRSQLAVRALRPTAVRFLVVQAVAQSAALASALLVGQMRDVELAWLAPLGAALLLVGVGVALRGLRWADARSRSSRTGRTTPPRAGVGGPS